MTQVSYFLNGGFLGSATLPERNENGYLIGAHSHAFFCQRCGDIWGRVLVHESEPHFDLHVRPCEKHDPIEAVPSWASNGLGGLFQHYLGRRELVSTMAWPLLPEFFPPPVLRREILLMYEHLKRNEDAKDVTSATA